MKQDYQHIYYVLCLQFLKLKEYQIFVLFCFFFNCFVCLRASYVERYLEISALASASAFKYKHCLLHNWNFF